MVSESSTGSTDSKRIRTNLTIQVKKIVFSAAGSEDDMLDSSNTNGVGSSDAMGGTAASGAGGSTLHISGPVSAESQFVKMGAYHTLDLEAGRDFTLIKAEDGWDSIGIERITEATQAAGGAEVGAIVCGEGCAERLYSFKVSILTSSSAGIANVCLITQHTTIVRQRIEVAIPRKRKGGGTALGADRVGDEGSDAPDTTFLIAIVGCDTLS